MSRALACVIGRQSGDYGRTRPFSRFCERASWVCRGDIWTRPDEIIFFAHEIGQKDAGPKVTHDQTQRPVMAGIH
jgi:hypothetical protein